MVDADQIPHDSRGGFRSSGKGFNMYKGVCPVWKGIRFDRFISFFLKYPLVRSEGPNYLIFIGYLKTGAGRGWGSSEPYEPPLDPPMDSTRTVCIIRTKVKPVFSGHSKIDKQRS